MRLPMIGAVSKPVVSKTQKKGGVKIMSDAFMSRACGKECCDDEKCHAKVDDPSETEETQLAGRRLQRMVQESLKQGGLGTELDEHARAHVEKMVAAGHGRGDC